MAFRAALFLLASLLLVSTEGTVTVTVPAASPKPVVPFPVFKPPPPTSLPAPAPIQPNPKPPVVTPPTVTPRPLIKTLADCGPQCQDRCSLHSRPNVCLRACGTCCQRCRCVPPGTAGNKEVCGKCYATMTTKGGKSKCP